MFICYAQHIKELNRVREEMDALLNTQVINEFRSIQNALNEALKATTPKPMTHKIEFGEIYPQILKVPFRNKQMIMSKVFEVSV